MTDTDKIIRMIDHRDHAHCVVKVEYFDYTENRSVTGAYEQTGHSLSGEPVAKDDPTFVLAHRTEYPPIVVETMETIAARNLSH